MSLPEGRLRPALVLSTTEDLCTVHADGRRHEIPYVGPFPRPRVERVAPGHLVAIADLADASPIVVWRWFDAVVVDVVGAMVSLWEPGHGAVIATPRDPHHVHRPGSRAYLSAGLPGADWWVAGPSVDRAEDADVDLDQVEQFFADLGLWEN